MRNCKKMPIFCLMTALFWTLLWIGNIGVEAEESEGTTVLSAVTEVRAIPTEDPEEEGIYTAAPIKLEVDYTIPKGYKAYGVEMYFAEEAVDINAEGADYAYYNDYLDDNELKAEASGDGTFTVSDYYAPDSPGTKILKKLVFMTVDSDGYAADECRYIYVEEGEHKGQLQLCDWEDNPLGEYIEGYSFEVKNRKHFMMIDSLELQPKKSQVALGDEVKVKIRLQNNTDEAITIPKYNVNDEWTESLAVCYHYIPEDSEELENYVYFYNDKELTIPANDSAVLEVPITVDKKGTYEIQSIDYYLGDKSMSYFLDYGNKLVLYDDGGHLVQNISLDNLMMNFTATQPSVPVVPVHVHNYITVTTKATLGQAGSIVTKCDSCGEIASSTRIPHPTSIGLSATNFTYDGKTKTPSVKVVGSDGKTISSSNYKLSYSAGRKKVGKYKVTVTFSGNYTGTVSKTFTILPKGTKLSNAKAGKKQMKLTWKKQTKETNGYQIQYSTNNKFKSGVKTKSITGNKKETLTIKSLKSKKVYYVRIRTWKKVSGGKLYSTWSSVKKVKIK